MTSYKNMNILRINKDSLTEELSYRTLLGDSIIKLKLAGHNINNDLVNNDNLIINDKSDAYLDIQSSAYLELCHQSGISSNPITLYSWLNEVDYELYNQVNSTGTIIPKGLINTFSLSETLQTRTITYTYKTYGNQSLEDRLRDPYEQTVGKPTIHTEPIKISDKLYNLLDSLIIIIPSNNHLFDNVEPEIIIKNKPSETKYHFITQLFITMKISQTDKKEYEIINSIEVYPPDETGVKSKQPEVNAVVLPWQAKVPYILSQNHQNISNLLKTKYTTIKTKFKIIDMNFYKSNLKSYKIKQLNSGGLLENNIQFMRSPDNIQWIQCFNDEWDVSDDTLVNKGYLYDTITGYQVISDWSLAGKLGNSKSGKRFFLLHERPIDDWDYIKGINKDDIWVYYESSKKTEYIWKVNNLKDALNEIEDKISNNSLNSLYLLSTNYTINVKQQILKKHNMEAIIDLT